MTTAELTALLATPAAFRAWLEAKEPGEVVGIWGASDKCPLAEWLSDTGIDGPCVSYDGIVWSSDDAVDPPWWARRFISELDDQIGPCPADPTAAECLRILGTIE
jgi:hypothetical protein